MGARADLLGPGDFESMLQFAQAFLPSVHNFADVEDVVQWVSKLAIASTAPSDSLKALVHDCKLCLKKLDTIQFWADCILIL